MGSAAGLRHAAHEVRDGAMPRWAKTTWNRVYARAARMPHIAAVFAIFGYVASDTPSLLPRPWYFQGLIAGISALIFFVLGVVLDLAWRRFARWSHLRVSVRPEARRVLTRIFLATMAIALLGYPFLNLSWHRYAADYVGQSGPAPPYLLLSALTGLAVLAAFVGVWHEVVDLTHRLTARIQRRVVRVAVAKLVATVVMVLLVVAVMDQIVIRGLLAAASAQAEMVNRAVPSGAFAPASPLRSGGPGSFVAWDSIGADGKSFISGGPTAARISFVTGEDAKEPVRVFASVEKTRSVEQTVQMVLGEMDRTDALERKAILVVTSTSTGFVNEWAAESFEYLLGGDTAIVTMQYSTLPSALGLLTARDEPPKVGRMLFDAVASRVAALPQGQRPKLYATGESLGAYGGNGAFDSPQDMLSKLDGAVWTGTPSFTPIHRTLTDSRTFGSTTANPTVDGGRHFRFAGNAAQLTADQFGHALGPWDSPRVVYLQHDNDPVVWWSADVALNTPEWLMETRTPGTPMSYMSWWPFVTFWQLTADMAMSNSVPGGYGHRYFETETVPAWAGVLGMDTNGDYRSIQASIKAVNEG